MELAPTISDFVTRVVVLEIATKVYTFFGLFSRNAREFNAEILGQLYECLVSLCWKILILHLNKGITRGKLQCCQFLLVLNISYLSIHDVTFVVSNHSVPYNEQSSLVFKLLFTFWIVYEIKFLFKVTKDLDIAKEIMVKAIQAKEQPNEYDVDSLTFSEVTEFFKGIPVMILSDGQSYQPENLPFPKHLEISLPQLSIIDHKSYYRDGFYGIGYKGLLRSHRPKGKLEVGIKKNKVLDKRGFKRFLNELKIMIFVGHHENILELIGAWTKDITEGCLHIVTEYCDNNTLHDYLCQIREKKTPEAPDDFTKEEMYRWVYEIASGMSFLINKGIIHGCLSAKTTLLTGNKSIRITEFGIAPYLPRFINQNVGFEPLSDDIKNSFAWRNLSWEALEYGNFSINSDIWSYASTAWEIFTFAQIPYSDFDELSFSFLDSIKTGTRPQLPDFVQINRKILESCWKLNPEERPDFNDILKSTYIVTRPKRRNISFQN